MKSKRYNSILIFILLFISVLTNPMLYIKEFCNKKIVNENNDPNIQGNTLTDEFTTIFNWNSSISEMYNNSYESLSMDSLVGNLSNFDPLNSSSYTNMDTINVTFQPSNASWSHFRDFDDNASLPSTNKGDMLNPYDTTVFFARKGAIYNITTSWEGYILTFANLETNLYLFNQSQFHDFEHYIKPWRLVILNTVGSFNSSHSSDDWIYEYSNEINNGGLPKTMSDTFNFTITINKTGWHYLVIWGPESTENPKVATYGELLSEGPANDNITVNDLTDMYRPSLGEIFPTITDPIKVYERVIRGADEIYGNSLVLMYIYEFSTRLAKDGLTTVDYDWMPYIAYINDSSVGKFPNRIIYYYDDNWYDDKDRHLQIIDPNFSSGDGFYQYTINITAEFAPFMNETVNMNANVSTTPISMENRIGSTIRLSITSNSHGCEIKPPHFADGATYTWIEIPKFPLNNSTLRKLYNDTIIEFLENGWELWASIGNKYYPKKTPFALYFNSLFTAPYLVSGLENILLVRQDVKDWFTTITPNNLYFNSRLDIEVNTTIDIPVNFTITYPENEPAVGQSCDFTLALGAIGNPNITIDYEVNYSMDFSMMLFTGSYNTTKKDTIHFLIPLQEINYLLEFFGVEDGLSGLASREFQKQIDELLSQSKVSEYISIENFLLGSHVVGNIVTCDIRIHLWPIIKDLIEKYKLEWYPACLIIDNLILNEDTGLDLILSPQLQGVVIGDIIGDGLEFENGGYFEFNDTQKSITLQANKTQDFSPTNIQLQSLLYKLNFHIDWAFEINFNDLIHFFGQEDLRWELGTYPSIDFAENPMDDSELIPLNWMEYSVPDPPTLTIITSSPTTSYDISLQWTASSDADNYTLYRHTSEITSSNLNSATELKTITGTSTTDTVPGIGRWYYAIIATNEVGNSDPSNSPFIDVQEEPSDGEGGVISGYPLIFSIAFSILGVIIILNKKKRLNKLRH